MQGLIVQVSIADEMPRVDVKSVKVARASNIGQGHWIKVYGEWAGGGETLCKV